MPKKEQFNFSMPESLRVEFNCLGDGMGKKARWQVAAAGILALLRLSDDERSFLLGRVNYGDSTGKWYDVIEESRAIGLIPRPPKLPPGMQGRPISPTSDAPPVNLPAPDATEGKKDQLPPNSKPSKRRPR